MFIWTWRNRAGSSFLWFFFRVCVCIIRIVLGRDWDGTWLEMYFVSRRLVQFGFTLFAIFVVSLFCFIHYTTRSNDAYSAVSEQTIRDTRNYDSGRNVTLIIGRPPHRIHLDDNLRVDKIHIAIRTTAKFHHSKMDPLILTWLQTATPNNVSSFKGYMSRVPLTFFTRSGGSSKTYMWGSINIYHLYRV